jgi:prolyl 4-hydroxylase
MRRPLFFAPHAGHDAAMNLTVSAQAQMLASSGRMAEALRLLELAAARADADALFTLATWRLAGQFLPRNLAMARDLFARAGRSGRGDAAAIHVAFVANGTGGPADWPQAMTLLERLATKDDGAREQVALIAAMRLADDGAPAALPAPERLSASPDVLFFPRLFTSRECEYLARLGEPRLEPAVVIDPRSGRPIRDPVRTSDCAPFPLALENPVVRALNRRIAAASGTDVAQGEPLQLLSYKPGQQYRAHVDALAGVDNQRILTALVYLNAGYKGGETRFLPDGPTVKGNKGDAIVFRNVDAAGNADPASRHAGLPVTAGRKLIASRWIRQRPLDLGEAKRAPSA